MSRFTVKLIKEDMQLDVLEDLLLTISYKEDDEISAHDAFKKIYREYSGSLNAGLKKTALTSGFDNDGIQSIVNDTFLKVYYDPLKFKAKEGENTDSCFKAWLYTIAKNLICDVLISMKKTVQLVELDILPEIAFIGLEIEVDEVNESDLQKSLQAALNSLKPRDREIYLTLYEYKQEGKHTPPEVLNELAEYFGTTKDNIRQIKKRCDDKIKTALCPLTSLKPLKR